MANWGQTLFSRNSLAADRELLGTARQHGIPAPAGGFRKLVAGKRLWNFQTMKETCGNRLCDRTAGLVV